MAERGSFRGNIRVDSNLSMEHNIVAGVNERSISNHPGQCDFVLYQLTSCIMLYYDISGQVLLSFVSLINSDMISKNYRDVSNNCPYNASLLYEWPVTCLRTG